MTVHLFGIRHHGVGSARSLRRALEVLAPDVVLIEGPPDADNIIPLAASPAIRPPVAMLIYNPAKPRDASWYPLAVYSPEWQAIQYALRQEVPVQFMDLPQKHMLALRADESASDEKTPSEPGGVPVPPPPLELTPELLIRLDPLRALAEAAGYEDSERWWDHMVEERQNPGLEAEGGSIFDAIREAMTTLREEAGNHPIALYEEREQLREAWMRRTIRAAERKYARMAVVCGAWHVPALEDRSGAAADKALLTGLPGVSTKATWAPWTYSRLSRDSGYGAGIESPGWYQHLWETPVEQIATRWMSRVAGLLRDADLSASTAQVIDGVRLAEALAALRDRPLPGLSELNEASLAVFCNGDDGPLQLIRDRLIVSETIGQVPDDVPTVPLQRDLEVQQKSLRMKPELAEKLLDLDLRKPTDLGRSHLLHRLALLDIPWGTEEKQQVKAMGTFHEYWRLRWQPEYVVSVIEASVWGNTIADAAGAYLRHVADTIDHLPRLAGLLQHVLLADLPDAARHVMERLQSTAALTADIALLMDTLPSLVDVLRYGNVRQTDSSMVTTIVDGLVVRICVGLLPACAALDDDTAQEMFDRLVRVNAAVTLLQNEEHSAEWTRALEQIAGRKTLHGLIVGRATRILRDAGKLSPAEVVTRLRLALSRAADPPQAAAWVDGFLKGSGAVLLFDDALWESMDQWVTSLPGDTFELLVPLLRRTFSTFQAPELRQMGERVRAGTRPAAATTADIDIERASRVLPVLGQLLGVKS